MQGGGGKASSVAGRGRGKKTASSSSLDRIEKREPAYILATGKGVSWVEKNLVSTRRWGTRASVLLSDTNGKGKRVLNRSAGKKKGEGGWSSVLVKDPDRKKMLCGEGEYLPEARKRKQLFFVIKGGIHAVRDRKKKKKRLFNFLLGKDPSNIYGLIHWEGKNPTVEGQGKKVRGIP